MLYASNGLDWFRASEPQKKWHSWLLKGRCNFVTLLSSVTSMLILPWIRDCHGDKCLFFSTRSDESALCYWKPFLPCPDSLQQSELTNIYLSISPYSQSYLFFFSHKSNQPFIHLQNKPPKWICSTLSARALLLFWDINQWKQSGHWCGLFHINENWTLLEELCVCENFFR